METRGTWGELIVGMGLQIAEVFNQAQEEYQPGIFEILNRKTGEGAQRTVTGKTGVGEISRFDDADNLPGGRRYKTYNTTIAYNNYGKFIDVSKNAIEDRDWDAELHEMRDLSIGANYSQDKSGMQLFNGGFATTADVNGYRMTWYGDGEPLFSTVHSTVVPGASTQSNASSVGITFSHDNLETAYVALIEQQTDDGLALSLMGKPMVIVPPALMKEAMEITTSELTPESANNAINVYRQGTPVDMATSVHLSGATGFGGSNTAWFLVVPGRHKLNHEVRQEPRLESEVNIKNKVATFTVDARWADSVTDWRRTYGTKGDGAAYSS